MSDTIIIIIFITIIMSFIQRTVFNNKGYIMVNTTDIDVHTM